MEAQAEPPRLSPVALIGSYFYAESVAPLSSAGAGVITTTPHKNVLQIMREIQRRRTIGDRPIIERMSATVDSPFIASDTTRRLEPALRAYRRLVLRLTR